MTHMNRDRRMPTFPRLKTQELGVCAVRSLEERGAVRGNSGQGVVRIRRIEMAYFLPVLVHGPECFGTEEVLPGPEPEVILLVHRECTSF